MSGTIGDIYKQMEYARLELTGSAEDRDPYGILNYNNVGTILKTSHSINDCSNIVLEIYENPEVQTQEVHELRQKLSRQVYDEYAGTTGLYNIYVSVQGNGTAFVNPTSVNVGDTYDLTVTPNVGESLIDIIAYAIRTGESVAVAAIVGTQTITQQVASSVMILVEFTGTPPTPPVLQAIKQKRMPIWMYPIFRKG